MTVNNRLIQARKALESFATDTKAFDGRYQAALEEEREAKIDPGIIRSNIATVIDRQLAYKVFIQKEFYLNPYNTAYWSSHLIEEICELADCPLDQQADESADVIIFLQNLTAYLYPKETLVIDLYSYNEPDIDLSYYVEEPIMAIRRNLYNRKSWKNYAEITFEKWLKVVDRVMLFILCYENPQDIAAAYQAKQAYNKTRTDWNRR